MQWSTRSHLDYPHREERHHQHGNRGHREPTCHPGRETRHAPVPARHATDLVLRLYQDMAVQLSRRPRDHGAYTGGYQGAAATKEA